jgi:hypothetical protein
MSGTHALEHPSYVHGLEGIAGRTVQGCRTFGSKVLEITSGGVSRFETFMTARSLPEGYERSAGLAALEAVNPSFARELEQRLNDN